MHKIWAVVRREYTERVRKKSFWITTLLLPLLMVGLLFIPFALIGLDTGEQRTIAVVDATRRVAGSFRETLEEDKLKSGEPRYRVEIVSLGDGVEATRTGLESRVADGDLYGVVTIGADLSDGDSFAFYSRNVGDIIALKTIQRALREAVIGVRLEQSELALAREELDRIIAPVRLETFQVSESGETTKKGFDQTYLGTFAFVMILYISLLLYGIAVMRGILEEKSNRIMEVLLGSLSPEQLMTGKILGIGLVGLTQMAVYATTAGVLRLVVVAAQFGAGWTSALSIQNMVFFVIFFLLGYFMYTALFAAVGSVCNSEQEAQNLQGPLIMCLVIPMASTFFFVAKPDSTIAVVVSLIPMFTPMVMFMRICVLTPPAWQIALSILIMLLTIWLLFKAVARVFRIGILMYGKRPTLLEIWRWARSST